MTQGGRAHGLASAAALATLFALAPAHADPSVPTAGSLSLSQPATEQGVLDQLNTLDRELQLVREQREATQQRLVQLEDSARRHDDEASSAQAQLDARRPAVQTRVRALYRLRRRGLARIVFGAESPAELRRRTVYLLAILEHDLARMSQFVQAMSGRAAAQAALDRDVNAATAARAELQLREAELRDQRARRLAMLENIRREESLARRAQSEYARVGRRLDGRLAALDGGLANIQASARTINPEGNFRDLFGRLPWPTTGRLTRRFGPYTDPVNGESFDSIGIEISTSYGTPFRSVFDGVVKLADFMPGYGQTVAVEHGSYTTVYSHADVLNVRRGDTVRAGDVLGQVGSTGLTDGRGTVLGFEVRYNGSPQDPLSWLSPR